jgi:hypothetical protein
MLGIFLVMAIIYGVIHLLGRIAQRAGLRRRNQEETVAGIALVEQITGEDLPQLIEEPLPDTVLGDPDTAFGEPDTALAEAAEYFIDEYGNIIDPAQILSGDYVFDDEIDSDYDGEVLLAEAVVS